MTTITTSAQIKTSIVERRACQPPPPLAKSEKTLSGPNYSQEKLEDLRRCSPNRTYKDIAHHHVTGKQVETKSRKLPSRIGSREDIVIHPFERKRRACKPPPPLAKTQSGPIESRSRKLPSRTEKPRANNLLYNRGTKLRANTRLYNRGIPRPPKSSVYA